MNEETTGTEDNLLIVPVPSLVSILLHAEKEKGFPLTEDEVLNIRDNAESIVMPRKVALEVEKNRGYKDIDPELAWEEWQMVRDQFHENT